MDQAEFDQQGIDDEAETQVALAQAYSMRPLRSAWRDDVANAPNGKPVYARELHSIRVIIAMRDDHEWTLINREGELHPLEDVVAWAPLSSALG
ncbi:MAG TPA: hypothetical protein VM915_05735 [Verrucomicrobiae bacterium]|nr:hypothetical protein [Verrucomicrobiae bacterium]